VLWGFGFFTNLYSDYQLRNLRKPGETGYKIPQGQFSQDLSSLCIPLVYAELSLLWQQQNNQQKTRILLWVSTPCILSISFFIKIVSSTRILYWHL